MTIRFDQCACGTSSTGAAALNLAAAPSALKAADPYSIWSGAGFGTSQGVDVSYSLVEYTDSTLVTPKQSEDGRGVLLFGANLAACTLTRTTPIQTVTGMDTGSITATGATAAPSAITIGTAANVVIYFGPVSHQFAEALPYYATSGVTSGDGAFGPDNILTGSSTTIGITNQTAIHIPVKIPSSGLIKSVMYRGTVAYTGGTASMAAALYEIGSDGKAGKKLIDFGSNASLPASTVTLTASAAVYIPPGWYILVLLPQFTGGSGSPTIRSQSGCGSSSFGTALASITGCPTATVASQTSLADPCVNTSIALVLANSAFPGVAFKAT